MSPRTAKSERRKKFRKSPPSLVYVELGTENGGMLKDLSEEGFALRTMMPVRPGYKTAFSIVLSASVKIEGQGEVLWIEENGRVAGLKFLEISPEAHPQIQGWLNGTLEKPAAPEGKPKETEAPGAKSFEDLRHELHAPPAAAPLPVPEPPAPSSPLLSLPAILSVEEAVDAPAAVEPSPVKESPAQDVKPAASEETRAVEASNETTSAAQPFPGLPDFSSTLQAIEISFDAIPPATERVPENLPRLRLPTPQSEPAILPEPEPERRDSAGLPEISKILMQPPGVEREFAMNSAALDSLDPPARGDGAAQTKWMEWFTLTRVVAIMILLALLVTVSAFHSALGDGLIWVGQALGGGQSHSSLGANPAEGGTSVPGSAAPEGSAEPANTPSGGEQSASQGGNSGSVPPATHGEKTPPASSAGNAAQETGLAEYSKALQLLHGRRSGADTSEAVRLLWDAVGKGNTSAELTLADLYWHGEGIDHNCDQTRNLLNIAAGKGNSDAQRLLRKLQQEGCR